MSAIIAPQSNQARGVRLEIKCGLSPDWMVEIAEAGNKRQTLALRASRRFVFKRGHHFARDFGLPQPSRACH
jgi:hypothetical protein